MSGKVIIVTGSNSGIGKATSKKLAEMGEIVVMAVRDRDKGEMAHREIIEDTGNEMTALMICDVSSIKSIRRFSNNFKDSFEKLDVLINNAGAIFMKREITQEGFEKTFATNYLGPFTLTNELLPILKKNVPSRIINISSGIHQIGKIEFQDLQNERNYRGMYAYANSKLLLTTHTYEQAHSMQGTGITANVVEPGFVSSNLGKNSGSMFLKLMFTIAKPLQIPPADAAKTIIWAAITPQLQKVTGKCFAKQEETTTADVSYDEEIQKLLKEKTQELLERHAY